MTKPVDGMQIVRVTISRDEYQNNKPFRAEIGIKGYNSYNSSLTINVDEQRTLDIIAIVAPLIEQAVQQELMSWAANAHALANPETKLIEGEVNATSAS
jgi:hypothetical protein